jgi:hypothetical protein
LNATRGGTRNGRESRVREKVGFVILVKNLLEFGWVGAICFLGWGNAELDE